LQLRDRTIERELTLSDPLQCGNRVVHGDHGVRPVSGGEVSPNIPLNSPASENATLAE